MSNILSGHENLPQGKNSNSSIDADKAAEEKQRIVNDLYKSFGSDSGILFGIKEREVVEAIVELTLNRLQSSQSGKERAALADKTKKELLIWIEKRFRTFGGEDIHNSAEWNPIAAAQKGKPLQFAAGVDVEQVIDYIEDFMQARQTLSTADKQTKNT